LWRALDPVMLALSGVAIGSKMPEKPAGEQEDTPVPSALWLLTGATVSGVLALGPVTPLWTAFASLPGLWRFAKPEAFVHLAILAVVPLAARGVGRLERRSRHAPGIALAAQVILWLWLVRSHPVYPGFSSLPG
jgi:hypothetical protein